MTSHPSKMQTGFCSPSSTRSLGATPLARSSFSSSATYCKGFCFVAIVAVSDMVALLAWTRLGGKNYFASAGGFEQNNSKAKTAIRLARHSIRVQQNLSRQAALQQREGILKLVQRRPLAKQRLQIQPPRFQQRSHLHPGFIHPPPVNSLHRRALENYVVHQIQRHVFRRDPQKRRPPSGPQRFESLLNRRGIPRHFQQRINSCAVRLR